MTLATFKTPKFKKFCKKYPEICVKPDPKPEPEPKKIPEAGTIGGLIAVIILGYALFRSKN